jgi:hypothetical protein
MLGMWAKRASILDGHVARSAYVFITSQLELMVITMQHAAFSPIHPGTDNMTLD